MNCCIMHSVKCSRELHSRLFSRLFTVQLVGNLIRAAHRTGRNTKHKGLPAGNTKHTQQYANQDYNIKLPLWTQCNELNPVLVSSGETYC